MRSRRSALRSAARDRSTRLPYAVIVRRRPRLRCRRGIARPRAYVDRTEDPMNPTKLYRGRLIDHLHLVVRDIARSRRFYGAVLEPLGISIGGRGPRSLLGRRAIRVVARVEGFGRGVDRPEPLRLPGQGSRRWSSAFTPPVWPRVDRITASPANGRTTPATTPRSCSTPTATTSRRSTTARPSVRPTRSCSIYSPRDVANGCRNR